MKTIIQIDNLKCHGCANTIRKEIGKMPEVISVEVIHETSSVEIEYGSSIDREEEFATRLKSLGYPKTGTGHIGNIVKSYVSCAIGRMNNESEIKNK